MAAGHEQLGSSAWLDHGGTRPGARCTPDLADRQDDASRSCFRCPSAVLADATSSICQPSAALLRKLGVLTDSVMHAAAVDTRLTYRLRTQSQDQALAGSGTAEVHPNTFRALIDAPHADDAEVDWALDDPTTLPGLQQHERDLLAGELLCHSLHLTSIVQGAVPCACLST